MHDLLRGDVRVATGKHRQPSAGIIDSLKGLVEGQLVPLSFDVTVQDVYKRGLAYVHVGTIFVNAVQIESGLATAAASGRNKQYRTLFQGLQAAAKAQQVGLWSD
jgi:endonuclease YncB( thermonuclease family)